MVKCFLYKETYQIKVTEIAVTFSILLNRPTDGLWRQSKYKKNPRHSGPGVPFMWKKKLMAAVCRLVALSTREK